MRGCLQIQTFTRPVKNDDWLKFCHWGNRHPICFSCTWHGSVIINNNNNPKHFTATICPLLDKSSFQKWPGVQETKQDVTKVLSLINKWEKIYQVYQGYLAWSCWTRICPAFANSTDSDQLASSEANWSGCTLIGIKYVNLCQQPGSNHLIGWRNGCGILIYSAWG